MANSIHQGVVLFDSSMYADGFAVDAAAVRDGLVNNALHLADECAQVRVNYCAESNTEYFGESVQFATDTWFRMAVFGPFPITLRNDGTSYRIRCRVRGYSSAAANISLRVVVAPLADLDGEANAGGVNTLTFTTNSTTDGWINGTGGNVVYLDVPRVQRWIDSMTTPTTAGGSTYTNVQACLACIAVYESTSSAAALPRLTGLVAEEYVGT